MSRFPKVAFATCAQLPEGWEDDHEPARLTKAEFAVWDDPAVDWEAYDRVVLRSVWDYSQRPADFVAWCRAVGPQRLRNVPELVAFAVDKRYLGELRVPTVATRFVAPGEPATLHGEVVVKPSISGGAGSTGRFGPGAHAAATALIERIHATGRTAMVQPFLADVDARGEVALVHFGGVLSHTLVKRGFLAPDEVAPLAGDVG